MTRKKAEKRENGKKAKEKEKDTRKKTEKEKDARIVVILFSRKLFLSCFACARIATHGC